MKTVHRALYRAQCQPGQEAAAVAHFQSAIAPIQRKVDQGEVLTASLFRWRSHFFAYWEGLQRALSPEELFGEVNKNVYRSTFFELCSRYLSRWFTWNVERSYLQGKSDPFGRLRAGLEFVGKYHERFAGMRWVIEFKYFSNSKVQSEKIKIDRFALHAEDTAQIQGYAQGLRQEYPEAQVALFVIYCFGNQGFRVFAL